MSRFLLVWACIVYLVSNFLSTATAAFSKDDSPANEFDQHLNATIFRPTRLALGTVPQLPANPPESFQLSVERSTATLDYGYETAGYPLFEVSSFSGKVQIEVKYSEAFNDLAQPFSDGPYPYAVTLSNTYRVETFEITKAGLLEPYLLQGGQRWQSIRLLTNGTVTFSNVGFRGTIPATETSSRGGSFNSDNELLNEVWKLGAVAAGAACVEEGTQKAMWNVSSDGAFVRGMRPAISANGTALEAYTLQFDMKIERGGMGWAVAFPVGYPNQGLLLNIVGELPSVTTFVNTNTSLTPKNSIILGYGYSLVNQTTLPSYNLDTFSIPFTVHEKAWYQIKTVLTSDQRLAVSLNGTQIFNVSLPEYYIGGSSIGTTGSIGFGGWQDQESTIKNVFVHDTETGVLLYSNAMTDPAIVLPEFGVHENYASVCLDGPKRDRLVWLGDFYHTVRIVAASTGRYDILRGTLQYFLDWQRPNGLFPISPPMGYDPTTASDAFATGGTDGVESYETSLPDYQILGLLAFTDYVSLSNDLDWTRQSWTKWQLQTSWILSNLNATTGLLSLPGFAFLGPVNGGSAISCAILSALRNMVDVAKAINDTEAATYYQDKFDSLQRSINEHLWNDELGIYSLSPDSLDDFSVAGLSFCITSGAATTTQTQRSLSALSALKLGPGYKDSTQVNSSDPTVNISPNTNGFLLSALISPNAGNHSDVTLNLLKTLWGAMLSNNETSTGASWEYVDQEGNPGLGLFTSLSHPWGGAPTYVLTEYAAGVRQAEGVDGFGYGNWVVDPSGGLAMGLRRATATVGTAFGGNLEVQWWVVGEKTVSVCIKAPKETSGVFEVGRVRRVLRGSEEYRFIVEMDVKN
ncbi:glycoside hydrolase family 78 protein [Cadophora sp. DSE1049]|nr:glycoside hydrolase family 78 protein [Cadophora sp. DSE1049]